MKPVLTDPVARDKATVLLDKMWFLVSDIDSLGLTPLQDEMVSNLREPLDDSMSSILAQLGVPSNRRQEALNMLNDGMETRSVVKEFGRIY